MIREWLHFEHAPCYSQAQAYHALTDGRSSTSGARDGREQLFDLTRDPKEERDLSDGSHRATLEGWRSASSTARQQTRGILRQWQAYTGRSYPPLNDGGMNEHQ